MKINKKFDIRRLLLLGCGNIGMRFISLVYKRFCVIAVTRNAKKCIELRAMGVIPIIADFDKPATLKRLAHLASIIVYLIPPQSHGMQDHRIHNLIAILPRHAMLVYISTTGVYGNCYGEIFDETRPVNPKTQRACRRVKAENILRSWARHSKSGLAILRTPSIYALDRLPILRLKEGLPVLQNSEDIYTNHIHAEDLVRIIFFALYRSKPLRIYHAVDDSDIKMGDYFEMLAQFLNFLSPPRLSLSTLSQKISSTRLSFMLESRRLRNYRLHHELGIKLLYPSILFFLQNSFLEVNQ